MGFIEISSYWLIIRELSSFIYFNIMTKRAASYDIDPHTYEQV